jgi:hypothetical protein
MLEWIVVKAVIGMKGVLLAGLSLLGSHDLGVRAASLIEIGGLSALSPAGVQAFELGSDDGECRMVVVVRRETSHEKCEARVVRVVRANERVSGAAGRVSRAEAKVQACAIAVEEAAARAKVLSSAI